MPLPLLALAIAAFGIGTTEFVIMGLLPNVARDLAVSIPAAGMLVSGYALGVTIGAPILGDRHRENAAQEGVDEPDRRVHRRQSAVRASRRTTGC